MPTFVFKLTPDEDAYVLWSTVVDSPISTVETRDECARHLTRYNGTEYIKERLARADRMGTSAQFPDEEKPFGSFHSQGMMVMESMEEHAPRWLPRGNLAAFCRAHDRDDMAGMLAATEPLDDDQEHT